MGMAMTSWGLYRSPASWEVGQRAPPQHPVPGSPKYGSRPDKPTIAMSMGNKLIEAISEFFDIINRRYLKIQIVDG